MAIYAHVHIYFVFTMVRNFFLLLGKNVAVWKLLLRTDYRWLRTVNVFVLVAESSVVYAQIAGRASYALRISCLCEWVSFLDLCATMLVSFVRLYIHRNVIAWLFYTHTHGEKKLQQLSVIGFYKLQSPVFLLFFTFFWQLSLSDVAYKCG